MKVNEIMSKDVKSLSPETPAPEALAMLEEMQISGLPVIDENNKLVGMLTEKEALTAILPSYIEKVGRFIYEENPKAVKQKTALLAKMKVKDIMRRSVITVDENTTLCEVAHIMLTQKARRLPVLSKDKVVAGMVSRGDVLKALFQE